MSTGNPNDLTQSELDSALKQIFTAPQFRFSNPHLSEFEIQNLRVGRPPKSPKFKLLLTSLGKPRLAGG